MTDDVRRLLSTTALFRFLVLFEIYVRSHLRSDAEIGIPFEYDFEETVLACDLSPTVLVYYVTI